MIYGAILEKRLEGFTYFKEIFCSLDNFQKDYNWLITDVEAVPFKESHYERITQSGTYAWISGEELTGIIMKDNFQWIWGVLSGFEKCYAKEEILKYDLPYADSQGGFWKTELSVQHLLASVELVAEKVARKEELGKENFMDIRKYQDLYEKANYGFF